MTFLEYKAYLKGRKDALEDLKKTLADDTDINLNRTYKSIYKKRIISKNLWNTKTVEFFKYIKLKAKVSLYHYIDGKINNEIKYINYQINNKSEEGIE